MRHLIRAFLIAFVVVVVAFFVFVNYGGNAMSTVNAGQGSREEGDELSDMIKTNFSQKKRGEKKVTKVDDWDWGDLPDGENVAQFHIEDLTSFPFVVTEYNFPAIQPFKIVLPWWDPAAKNVLKGKKLEPTKMMEFYHELLSAFLPSEQRSFGPNPPTVIDVGSYIGHFTLIAASMGLKVLAYEPSLANAEKIRLNVAINHLEPLVTLIEAAVSDQIGQLEMAMPTDPRLAPYSSCIAETVLSHLPPEQSKYPAVNTPPIQWEEVVMVRLDYSVEWLNLTSDIILLRVSVEGHELPALKGALHLFRTKRVRSILHEFWPKAIRNNGDAPLDLLRFISQMGFTLKLLVDHGTVNTIHEQQYFELAELDHKVHLYWQQR